jgi:DNA-binding PadR family transcriptional regulator
VRAAVLELLTEQPMHGYQLMHAIADRTGGRWTPSPGAIYPTISQLEDEGLVVIAAESGRKLVTLTDEGRALAQADRDAGVDPFTRFEPASPGLDLRRLSDELRNAVRDVARHGDSTMRSATAAILADARKRVYLLLAEGSAESDASYVARASVATAKPERYVKQLAAHFGRRSEVRAEPSGTRVILTDGECLLRTGDDSIELVVSADDPDRLESVKQVVGSHLERFGQRDGLTVSWT